MGRSKRRSRSLERSDARTPEGEVDILLCTHTHTQTPFPSALALRFTGIRLKVTEMKISHARTILAGVAGGSAMNLAMLLTFRLIGFGINAEGVLLDPSLQSKKLIAVWTEIEPLPPGRRPASPHPPGDRPLRDHPRLPLPLDQPRLAAGDRSARPLLRAPRLPDGVSILGVLHPLQHLRRAPPPHRPGALLLGRHRPRRRPRDLGDHGARGVGMRGSYGG